LETLDKTKINMKKTFLLLSIITLTLQSCSSGENSSETINDNSSLLVRRWYHVSSTYQGTTNYSIICSNNGHRDYVDFLSPNIAKFYYVESSIGNNCSDQYVLEQMNWIKNGNTINLTFSGTNVLASTCVISELTATTLKFVETDATTNQSSLLVYSSY
jgi:hypothetical protein